jgi:hypothetical protein
VPAVDFIGVVESDDGGWHVGGGYRKRLMRFARLILILVCVGWPIVGAAQDAAEIDKTADMMVRLCLGGGRSEAVSGSSAADLSLRSLDVKGNVKGEFKISKSSAEGLVGGIDNALSQIAADQADKVRACLQPVRERLLDLMLPLKRQGSARQTVTAPGGKVTTTPWVRVTDIDAMKFSSIPAASGGYEVIIPHGIVRGTVSNSRLSVFLLIKEVNTKDGDQVSNRTSLWNVTEAVVDAVGNWSGTVCPIEQVRSPKEPIFGWWEIMALATSEPEPLRERVTEETCSAMAESLFSIREVVCSETNIKMWVGKGFEGGLFGVRPKPRRPCSDVTK